MIPTKVTVYQIFSPQCRYLVPIFQRQYVWDMRDQWEPLWEDIVQKAHEVAAGGTRPPRKHFMGAIVLRGLSFTGREHPGVEVIDGQQRLTTLQIVLIALRDFCRNAKIPVTANSLGQMSENPVIYQTELEQLKVIPTTRDRDCFHNLWDAGSPAELLKRYPPIKRPYAKKPEPPPRLVAAYLFFAEAIRCFAEKPWDDDDPTTVIDANTITIRVHHLYTALANYLELVKIDLDETDDPQVIFETLNARGVRLRAGDLVRNYVFLEASRVTGKQDEVTRLYTTYWRLYDETATAAFWKEEVRQGRLVNPRFELFLFNFLTSQLTKVDDSIQMSHLYRAFCDWWLGGASTLTREVEPTLRELTRYSDFYRRLYTHDDRDRLAVFGRRLRTMDVSTIYPLLLFLFVERAEETKADLDGIITDLESYLVRRMVCELTTKGYNRTFLKMLADLRRGGPITRHVIQQYLLNLSGPTVEWPDDALFAARWLHTPVYDKLRTGPCRSCWRLWSGSTTGRSKSMPRFPPQPTRLSTSSPKRRMSPCGPFRSLPMPMSRHGRVRLTPAHACETPSATSRWSPSR